MDYPGKEAYLGEEVVSGYEAGRFKSLKGRLTHQREMFLIERAIHDAGIRPPARILDLPCGTGRLSIRLAQQGFRVEGVDISPAMVSYAREKACRLNLEEGIGFRIGDAEFLPYREDAFAAAVSLRLFGHTPASRRIAILTELKRVTDKNLILAYYDRRSLQHWLRAIRRRVKIVPWHPVVSAEIAGELKRTGLKWIKVFYLARRISETMVVLAAK